MAKNIEIGAYEAKTHLPRLLREVAEGQSFTITLRGKPVARLGPDEPKDRSMANFNAKLKAFHSKNNLPALSRDDLRALTEEGRD